MKYRCGRCGGSDIHNEYDPTYFECNNCGLKWVTDITKKPSLKTGITAIEDIRNKGDRASMSEWKKSNSYTQGIKETIRICTSKTVTLTGTPTPTDSFLPDLTDIAETGDVWCVEGSEDKHMVVKKVDGKFQAFSNVTRVIGRFVETVPIKINAGDVLIKIGEAVVQPKQNDKETLDTKPKHYHPNMNFTETAQIQEYVNNNILNCGQHDAETRNRVALWAGLALKHLLRLGLKDDILVEINKSENYCHRAQFGKWIERKHD